MFSTLLISILVLTLPTQDNMQLELSAGPNYSSYLLYQDDQDSRGQWQFGAEIGVSNFIPRIGVKIRGGWIKYEATEQNDYIYEYMPVTFCTSFDLLAFTKLERLKITLETGFGLYMWKGLDGGEVVVLQDGEKMQESDIGFVGGLTVQIRPFKNIGVEYATRYNYIASSNIYKYGFLDKDDKIWENGIGVKIIWP